LLPIHTEKVDSRTWEKLSAVPELVDRIPKNVDRHKIFET